METWVLFLLFSPVYIPLVISLAIFFNSERKNYAKKTLSLVLFNISVLFFGLYFFLTGQYEFYSKILTFNVLSLLLVYPSIYIYIRQLIEQKYAVKKMAVHLIPVVFILLQTVAYFFMLNSQDREMFVKDYRFNPAWNNPAIVFIFFCRVFNILVLFFQIFYYGIKITLILKKYNSTIHNYFSNTEGISLNSIKILNFSLFIGSIASIAFYSINPVKVFGNYIVLIIPLAIISITIWLFGIVGLRQKMLPANLPVVLETNDTNQLVPNKELYHRLISYFDKEKPYLNPELKIDDLIGDLGTNRTHLSNAINLNSGKNFNKFVNDYRIEFAKQYMRENKNNSLKEDVAYKSGFGSIRTFERNFKEIVGESYSQYITSVQ
ncbi:AraC family transcriptional regulator [Plebeiibacterium sediminum]|uniref:Helix-turn-helix domain-containing protein n=1 Tax=Plebeiibacterium sediminum TaxID=2992112 RepID=A0AAE3SF49_9BACT|nr:helix-turn-helix domain-containing protein [Plebeiobacterium sediminum]MCW3787095.1 helix-turn-helix domain-containing protein [Plebeiobacterium sediminum]